MKKENLTRATRRKYLTRTSYYKRIAILPLKHADRIAHYDMISLQGKESYNKNIEEIRQKLAEDLAPLEKKMIADLNSKGIEKSEIDSYLEKWVDVNFWPRPKNYHKVKRELVKLNKKYFT